MIEKHPENIGIGSISTQPSITMDIVNQHLDNWDWAGISESNLTMEMIEKYPEKPWEWNISINPNITTDCRKIR